MTRETELKIKSYIQKFANAHNLTYEEAKAIAICRLAAKYYGEDKTYEDDRNDISR